MLRSNSADTSASTYGSEFSGSNPVTAGQKMDFSTPMKSQGSPMAYHRKYDDYYASQSQGQIQSQAQSQGQAQTYGQAQQYHGTTNWPRSNARRGSSSAASATPLGPINTPFETMGLKFPNLRINDSGGSSGLLESREGKYQWGNTPTFATSDAYKREQYGKSYESSPVDEVTRYRMELKLKDSTIESLCTEIEVLRNIIQSSGADITGKAGKDDKQSQIQLLEEKARDAEMRLETVLTAIALNPNPGAATRTGRYDEQEMAHKIFTKMKILTEENDEMAKMLSFGRSKQKDIQIGLLKAENEELKERLQKLETTT
ncbi:unnamed protein product [Kuraishia capsulata CBS 1993]|uniref:Protein MUM2 n=1 Tax=Kuraishia capsulata CBS 1993 TaxID=1382522 RepID=W6MGG2_9ASCO|nr:uncharacterized protein KUCA_T00001151001 [Kuraishia capsulata CBS 1993]CDK25184.1 unnamed protein product [Kuraishia capsulata CBS 1993]